MQKVKTKKAPWVGLKLLKFSTSNVNAPYGGAFTFDVTLVLNENLGGVLDGTQC
jgi:hypothetical protein